MNDEQRKEKEYRSFVSTLKPIDRFALRITDLVGSVKFFLVIFAWTTLWTGYNILASEVPRLNWKPFDAFPAFVAYLLISNIIQILLMPLILVGQNLQSEHAESRAMEDFHINQKAEMEIRLIKRHLHTNTEILMVLADHLECPIPDKLNPDHCS